MLNLADSELHQYASLVQLEAALTLNQHRALTGAAYPSPSIASTSSSYPTTTVLSSITELSIPRPTSRSSTSSPPSAERKPSTIGRASGSTGSRLAALFAKAPPPGEMHDVPAVSDLEPAAVVEAPATSEPTSLFPSFTRSSQLSLDVVVLAINKVVRHADIVKAIGKTLDFQLREALKGIEGCEGEGAVIDRICTFASRFQPPPTWTSSLPPSGKSTQPDSHYGKDVEELSDAFQDLFHAVRLDLTRNVRAAGVRERRRAGDAVEKEVEEEDLGLLERRVDASLERIEELVTTALYDRLFSPAASNDSQLDENLSSRIAALNILELSLEHLGLDLGGDGGPDGWDESSRTIRDSLEDVIGVAGVGELGKPLFVGSKADGSSPQSSHGCKILRSARLAPRWTSLSTCTRSSSRT
mgnify:FL=1